MSPRLVDVDKKKKEIIEATIKTLTAKGINDIRIKDIADNLEIAKSTIYEYFDNKDELLKQTFEYFLQELYIPVRNEEYSFLEEVKLVLKKMQDHNQEELKMFSIIMDVYYHGIKGDFKLLNEIYYDYIDYMAEKMKRDQKKGIIRKDIEPRAFVTWVGGTLDGLGLQIMLELENYEGDKIFFSFIRVLESYLKENIK